MQLVEEIEADNHDVIIINFANPDMVGHSGMLEPTIKAVEAIDECLGKVVEAILAKGGVASSQLIMAMQTLLLTRKGSLYCTYDESGSFHRCERLPEY